MCINAAVPTKLVLALTLLAAPAVAEPAPSWNCTLHRPGTKEGETLNIHRQSNGYYGDGKASFFKVIEDGQWAFVAAIAETGIIEETNTNVIGVQTLTIDKRTHLARLSYDYLTGFPDKTLYGSCVPG